MPAPPDRKEKLLEKDATKYPLPPLNLHVLWAFAAPHNAVDVRWTDPTELHQNDKWQIEGVNVYRSTDSQYGPYHKLNDEPLGSTFYRDETLNERVEKEDVSNRFLSRDGEWVFKPKNIPLVKPNSENTAANHPKDVKVWIDGQEVIPSRVDGEDGEIHLRTDQRYDQEANELKDPVLPDDDSTVECSYTYNINVLKKRHYQRIFYRVTAVGVRDFDGKRRESPLKWSESKTIHDMEQRSSLWEEAIRRNQWMLDQGGERVKVFIRKYMGDRCDCWDKEFKQASHDCLDCYSTGIKGGFEGPFELIIAPPDSEKSIELGERGLHIEQNYETWTGPNPLLNQRDFVVRQNNDRYGIGGVRTPTHRGAILQQHFQMELFDEEDIRYEVPVTGTESLGYPETRTVDPEDTGDEVRWPQITDKEDVPDEVEKKGRTAVWENLEY